MKKEVRDEIAMFRYGLIAPYLSKSHDDSTSLRAFLIEASKKTYRDYKGNNVEVSVPTLERWYYAYRKHGFEGLYPQKRKDVGKFRKLNSEAMDEIERLKRKHPAMPTTLIYHKLKEDGFKGISLSSVNRFVNQLKIAKATDDQKEMRRYEKDHTNELWHGDTSVGPYVEIDKVKKKTYIIALIDDASRCVVGADIFIEDNFNNVCCVMKSAIRRFGYPLMFNFDNGTPYKNTQMTL